MMPDWLSIHRGNSPLIVTFPHTGTDIPGEIAGGFVSPDLARKDADWYVDRLYDFAAGMGATTVHTALSRSVIDVNRDPSGVSLYPGQATTGLCPLTTFDDEPLYRSGMEPDETEIARRRETYFQPYHDAVAAEIARLRALHDRVVLYDAHSIRSEVPRLFEGLLPVFNIGTNFGQTCAGELAGAVEEICTASGEPTVRDGRFRGGWTVRHYGRPHEGVHAIQMELADRGYLDEPVGPVSAETWPVPYDPARAGPLQSVLREILTACLGFAETA